MARAVTCALGWCWVPAFAPVSGCRPQPAPQAETVADVAERGPLKLTVQARPKQVWLGDPIEIRVQVHAPDDFLVQLPTPDDLGDVTAAVVDAPDPQPAPDGGLDWRRTFTVERYVSGTFEIPPLVVRYARGTSTETQPALENELAAGPLKLEIRSALTTQDSVTQPRDITGTLMPQRTLGELLRTGLTVAAIAVITAAAILLPLLLWLRRKRAVPPVLPEVWALQALAELRGQDWIGTGRAREFYYRLSDIVRAYVERKFALAAPEMTTEEFLLALARDGGALPYDPDRLREFLQACDLVKYAAYSPRQQDADQALSTARTFVHETAAAAERAAQLARPAASAPMAPSEKEWAA